MLLFIGLSLCIVLWIWADTRPQIFSNSDTIENRKIVLILGTSRWRSQGKENPYFVARMDAAAELYFKGKVQNLLISGDGMGKYYNENREMRKSLLNRGIPDSVIVDDKKGIDTLASMANAHKNIPNEKITIISQPFHLPRALFIGKSMGLDCIAFTAEQPSLTEGFYLYLREYFGQLDAFIKLKL